MSHRPAHIHRPTTAPLWLVEFTRNIEREIDRVADLFGGTLSAGNSSTTTLAGGATFTGTAEQDVHPQVLVCVKSDVAGTLYLDFSPDGTNWDEVYPASGSVVAAGVHTRVMTIKGPRYFRVRYVNGAGAQSYFRLNTYYGLFE